MENVLAIDIGKDLVQGLVVESGPKSMEVLQYVTIERREDPLEDSLQQLVGELTVEWGPCRVCLETDRLINRNLSMPFSDRQKIDKVFPLELEEVTTYSGQGVHYDFLVNTEEGGGAEVVATLLPRQDMAEILAALQAQGLDPELVTVRGIPEVLEILERNRELPSFLLIDARLDRCTLLVVENRRICLIRTMKLVEQTSAIGSGLDEAGEGMAGRIAAMVQTTLLSAQKSVFMQEAFPCYVTGPEADRVLSEVLSDLGLTVESYLAEDRLYLKIESEKVGRWHDAELNSTLSLVFCDKKDRNLINLRTGIFRKRRSVRQVRNLGLRAVLPVAGIFLVLVVAGFMQIQGLKGQRDVLNSEITSLFQQTFPEVTKIQDPYKQMEIRVREARELYSGGDGSDAFRKLDLIAELSTRIPPNLPIRLNRFVADRDDLRLRGETGDFNTVDAVQKELEKSGYFRSVEISSANLSPKGDGVRFELKLEYGRE